MSVPTTMQAWAVHTPGPLDTRPLRLVEREVPTPAHDEVLLEIEACGVCRTDLHLAEGDLSPRHPVTIPGHEVVGRVSRPRRRRRSLRPRRPSRRGVAATNLRAMSLVSPRPGEPVSVVGVHGMGCRRRLRALLHRPRSLRLCAARRHCRPRPGATAVLRNHRLPRAAASALHPGGRLGIYGFGASAHLTAQVAIARGARVHVLTRSESAQRLALDLGAVSAGDADEEPPEPLDAAILFALSGASSPWRCALLTGAAGSPLRASPVRHPRFVV